MSTGLVIVIGLAAVLIAIIWHFFVAPLEKQMHERRMEMIQRKLARREQDRDEQGDNGESA